MSKNEVGLISRFALAGCINTLADWITYFVVLSYLGDSQPRETVAKTLGCIVGINIAYILNYVWVFKRCKTTAIEASGKVATYIKFLLCYATGMLINVLSFKYFRLLLINDFICLILATLSSFAFNFFGSKAFVFNMSSSEGDSDEL